MAAVFVVALVVSACGDPDGELLETRGDAAASSPTSEITERDVIPGPDECVVTGVSIAQIPDLDDLTWASEQIIVGVVEESYPTVPDPEYPRLPLYTEYAVQIEQVFRGDSIDKLRIRQPGGSIPGGCEDFMGAFPIKRGNRFLLFLSHQQANTDVPSYLVVGERQGYWSLTDDGSFANLAPHFEEYESASIEAVSREIATVLSASAPTDPIVGFIPVVSLAEAPRGADLPNSR